MNINKERIPLLEGLKKYSLRDISCFDVPGHVKNQGVPILNEYLGDELMNMDINASPTMDDALNPSGIIKEAQRLLADAYSCDEAFFVTNGTTQAIHCMIMSVIEPGDKILLPRNVHKSAINALIMSGGVPIFIQPQFDYELGISLNLDADVVKQAIEDNSDIKALFLLNPTYYGACGDLKQIIKVCKEHEVLVLVDEAHGAHFPFHEELPPSSMKLGADMSAVSIHKTGGALTQASALLINNDNIDTKKVRQIINMLQSTSTSYLLMASIDGARYNLVENGHKQLSQALSLARYAKAKLDEIDGVKVISTELKESNKVCYIDETKLCINVEKLNLTGFEVYEILYKEFDIQVELGDLYNILALVAIGTTKRDIDRLIKAIYEIATSYKRNNKLTIIDIKQITPQVKLNPRQAFYMQKESMKLENCINKVSGEFVMVYPPGIPIVAPGEVITEEIIDYINILKNENAYITGMNDENVQTLMVIKN